MRSLVSSAVAMTALAGALARAPAASARTDEAAERAAPRIEVIEVIADRRARSVQDVPIAVTALSREAIENEGLADLEDLGYATPALSVSKFYKGAPQIYLRGIGSNQRGAGGDPSVGLFIDDVYVGRAAAAEFDYVNIERIEVLRGPQGALYGKNVVGGAINVITAEPEPEPHADIELSAGNYRALHLRGQVNAPLSRRVYANLAFGARNRDGYIDNAFTGADLNNENSQTLRGQVLLDGASASLRLTADYSRDRALGLGRESRDFLFAAASPDRYRVEQDLDGFEHRDVWGLSARARTQTPFGELLSIAAYRAAQYDGLFDLDGLNPGATRLSLAQRIAEDAEQFSWELRLNSAISAALNGVFGLYAFREEVERLTGAIVSGVSEANEQFNITTSYAAFGHAAWAFAPRWSLNLGGRLTYEEKDHRNTLLALGDAYLPSGNPEEIVFAGHIDASWSNFSPQATLEFSASEDVFLYGVLSRGFKSGGFSEQPASQLAAETPTDQEIATNYEIGAKTEWFDGRLRVNGAGFYIDYEDLQVSQFIPDPDNPDSVGLVVLRNAATASSRGVELEWSVLPSSHLALSGHYAYVDASYDEFIDGAGRDNSGKQLTRHPKHQFFIAADTWRDLAGGATISARLSVSAQSEVFIDPENNPVARIHPYELVNARIAYQWPNGFEAALWARNLLDTYYEQHVFDVPANSQGRVAVVGQPRMFGVQLRWPSN